MGVDEPEELGDGERVRIGQEEQRALRRDRVGPPEDHEAFLGLHGVEGEGVDPTRAESGREHRERGTVFDLATAARDRDRGRAEHRLRLEELAEAARDVFEGAHVMR